jgi:hypothetical protein
MSLKRVRVEPEGKERTERTTADLMPPPQPRKCRRIQRWPSDLALFYLDGLSDRQVDRIPADRFNLKLHTDILSVIFELRHQFTPLEMMPPKARMYLGGWFCFLCLSDYCSRSKTYRCADGIADIVRAFKKDEKLWRIIKLKLECVMQVTENGQGFLHCGNSYTTDGHFGFYTLAAFRLQQEKGLRKIRITHMIQTGCPLLHRIDRMQKHIRNHP